ncbi:MAG: polar amino acid transport system substrate-binding protein [Paraglaciecola sp.]|jgi:polar amino acid transport system substrate-binding protein
MKYTSLYILAILLFSPLARSTDLSVGWELWYPYQYHNKQNELVGLDIESFNAIMSQAKLTYTTAEIPWKTHLHFIKTGKIDIAMGASWSKEREEIAYFSLPYRQETVKLFVKKGNAKNISLGSLTDLVGSPYLIGVEGGYFYGLEYQTLIKRLDFQANISEVIDLEQNVSLVLDGNLNGFLVDPITMKAFVKKYKMDNLFEQHPVEIYSADIHIMLSKKTLNESVLNKINQAIESLQKEGGLQKISLRWSTLQKTN